MGARLEDQTYVFGQAPTPRVRVIGLVPQLPMRNLAPISGNERAGKTEVARKRLQYRPKK